MMLVVVSVLLLLGMSHAQQQVPPFCVYSLTMRNPNYVNVFRGTVFYVHFELVVCRKQHRWTRICSSSGHRRLWRKCSVSTPSRSARQLLVCTQSAQQHDLDADYRFE